MEGRKRGQKQGKGNRGIKICYNCTTMTKVRIKEQEKKIIKTGESGVEFVSRD